MVRKIGRIISNAFSGRRQFKEESLTFEETKKLLAELSTKNCKRGWVVYRHADPKKYLNQATTVARAYEFFSKQLDPSLLVYVDYSFSGNYQAYSNSRKKMHYIDVRVKEAILIKNEKKTRVKRLNLEFLIENPPTTPRR